MYKAKFGTKTDAMQNQMVIFSVLDRKYSFWPNLVWKIKIAEAEIWYLDQIEYVEFDAYFFLFLDQKYPFFGINLVIKVKI